VRISYFLPNRMRGKFSVLGEWNLMNVSSNDVIPFRKPFRGGWGRCELPAALVQSSPNSCHRPAFWFSRITPRIMTHKVSNMRHLTFTHKTPFISLKNGEHEHELASTPQPKHRAPSSFPDNNVQNILTLQKMRASYSLSFKNQVIEPYRD